VSKTASATEIKLAYFREAKAAHPDLNPGAKDGKEKFQRVAAAYEILKDPERRRQYDIMGGGWGGEAKQRQSQHQRQQQQQWQQQQQQQEWWSATHHNHGAQQEYDAAMRIFRSAMRDSVVIKEALANYVEDVTAEMMYAAECVGRGELGRAMDVVKANSGLFLGVILPVAIFLRAPALVTVALSVGGRVAFQLLFVTGQLPRAAEWLWARAVSIAAERNKRRAERGST